MHKLLTPQVARLGRPDVPPETDAVAPHTPGNVIELAVENLGAQRQIIHSWDH